MKSSCWQSSLLFVAVFVAALGATEGAGDSVPPAVMEFRYKEGRTIYPAYRTWNFEIMEPGLYAFDILPTEAAVRPAVRLWLDDIQIGFARDAEDYVAKADGKGRFRRFRWLEVGTHSLDLYLHLGHLEFQDEMEKAMVEKGIKVRLERLSTNDNCHNCSQIASTSEVVGFWMEGTAPDCMARVMCEPLVVAGCAGGFNAEAQGRREFTMEVSDGWSQTLSVGDKPVRFEYPCDREGAFKYQIKNDKGEVVEGPWDFVVTDISHKEHKGHKENVELIDTVDCAEGAGGPHLFREGGKSEIVETPYGAYRQTGPQGCKDTFYKSVGKNGEWEKTRRGKQGRGQWRRDFDWFGYTLHVEHPGKTHLLVCKIPNDVRRLTHVFAFDRRTKLSNAWGLDTGDAPASGAWSEMRIPVWPNSDALDIMVVNTDGVRNSHAPHSNRRGAVASFELLEYPDGLPPLPAPACGWNGRMFGWDGEQVDLGPNERTMPRLSDEAVVASWQPDTARTNRGPARDWNDFAAAWERTFEFEEWRGGNILLYPVFSYGMVSFQGTAQKIIPPANDRYAVDRTGAGNRDPFDRDVFALMLQRAQKHGVKLAADFMVQRTYADVAAAWARYCGMDGATNGFYLSKTADGSPFRTPSIYAGLPNPAHPVARAAQIGFCREFGRRYGRYASFAGIHHRFWKGWAGSFEPWFLDADTGFDDFTVGEFSKATGISLPSVGKNETAFAERKAQLLSTYAREWESWRCKVCRTLHEEMLAALREGAPEARFFMASIRSAFELGTGLCKSDFQDNPAFGFDPALLLMDGPGVEINRLDPAKFGNFFPHMNQETVPLGKRVVPNSIVCNRSFRASPYHLEPAALALSQNRLETLLAGGQWTLPPADDALREFVRAYRAIPDRDDWIRGEQEEVGGNSPVAVWWAKDGDDVLFWCVNRTDTRRRVVLTFDKEPKSVQDCVKGEMIAFASGSLGVSEKVSTIQDLQDSKIPKNSPAPQASGWVSATHELRSSRKAPSESKKSCEIALSPFMPGVYRAHGVSGVVSYEVPVGKAERQKIYRDFEFIKGMGGRVSSHAVAGVSPRQSFGTPVEVSAMSGETYCDSAGAIGKRDQRWTFNGLFKPMAAAEKSGDIHTLRALVDDFKTNHRWWFEAFGWPEDLCVTRNVGRKTLAGFMDYRHKFGKREEIAIVGTNVISTVAFPQAKGEFVCLPRGVPLEIEYSGQHGGRLQLELTALFGGGYDNIQVENADGKPLGVIIASPFRETKSPRLETRILYVPISNPGKMVRVQLVGMGSAGLAIHRLGFARLPSRPVSTWHVIGPFDAGRRQRKDSGEAVAASSFPPEKGFDSNAVYSGVGGKAIVWRTVSLSEGERVLDLKPLAPCDISSEFGVAYLYTTVSSPNARRTTMRWVNDWFGAVWLNGMPVVPKMSGPSKEYGAVEVHLKPGKNEILVKTAAGSSGAWFFGMALDDDGTLCFDSEEPFSGIPCDRVATYVREARAAYRTPAFSSGAGTVIHRYSLENPFGPDPREDMPKASNGKSEEDLPRFFWIHGLRNVRDIGGWTGLRTNRVFRGSQLRRTDGPDGISDMTRRGLLGLLGVRTELDLRGVDKWGVIDYAERDLADMGKAGIDCVNIPFPSYLDLLDAKNAAAVAAAVRVFADPERYPIYVHCAGGADRTGALVMILEGLCGVDEADIDVDYELTSFAVVYGLRHRDETERLKWKSLKDALRAAAPESTTLDAAIETWCRRSLGISDADIAAIWENLK